MGHLRLQLDGLINCLRRPFKYTPPAADDEVTAEIVQLLPGTDGIAGVTLSSSHSLRSARNPLHHSCKCMEAARQLLSHRGAKSMSAMSAIRETSGVVPVNLTVAAHDPKPILSVSKVFFCYSLCVSEISVTHLPNCSMTALASPECCRSHDVSGSGAIASIRIAIRLERCVS
jgi:hypothetical protein